MESVQLFTIGRADRRIEALVGELAFHGVTHVLDIRPCEGRNINCSDTSSKMICSGIRYADLGRLFGYLDAASVLEALATRESDRHEANVQILLEMSKDADRRLCLLGEPHEAHQCHRALLLGDSLQANGVIVTHIENGMALAHPFVMQRLLAIA